MKKNVMTQFCKRPNQTKRTNKAKSRKNVNLQCGWVSRIVHYRFWSIMIVVVVENRNENNNNKSTIIIIIISLFIFNEEIEFSILSSAIFFIFQKNGPTKIIINVSKNPTSYIITTHQTWLLSTTKKISIFFIWPKNTFRFYLVQNEIYFSTTIFQTERIIQKKCHLLSYHLLYHLRQRKNTKSRDVSCWFVFFQTSDLNL